MSIVAGTIAVLASAVGFSFYQAHGKPPILATTVAVLATAYSLRQFFAKRRQLRDDNQPRQMLSRHGKKDDRMLWSFTSLNMAKGSFPQNVQFGDPVINGVMVFQDAKIKKSLEEEKISSSLLEIVNQKLHSRSFDFLQTLQVPQIP